uniref:Uncharacterized protein n=1 Tax=Castor canadensis TaxID=51338 RepID=A0A8C0W7V6_CASCN
PRPLAGARRGGGEDRRGPRRPAALRSATRHGAGEGKGARGRRPAPPGSPGAAATPAAAGAIHGKGPARVQSRRRGARPAPLRAPARPTQPLEPILIPKLRIRLADFPYLHCSNMPEAVHLGDLLRIWVRPGARFTPSPPDFQGRTRSRAPCPSRRKENSPRGSRRLLRDRRV